ncbi:MAG TPA: ATP-binding cassette domain-containing protein [Candidatus Fournierella merdigallinarum]|nr:ATP-binding cassette domain-containing protein [Candidatus Fournierella merdigallinarum]
MSEYLQVQNLKKYFQTPKGLLHAVDDVSFQVEQGRTLGVVGESGCGKSTLGRVILHLLDSTGGRIVLNGEDITHANRRRLHTLREEMQMIFQDPFSSLNPRMSVFQLISEPLVIKGGLSKEEIRQRTNEIMATVGIPERMAASYPHELDGGRRQRVGIARALILNPHFIVCDEPVSALDVSIQAQIINLMLDLQEKRGLTYLFITHDLSVVRYLAHDIIVMYLGQIVEQGPAEEIFRAPQHPYTKALLSAIPIPDVHTQQNKILMTGEPSSPVNPKPGCRFCSRCPYAEEKCRQKQTAAEVSAGHSVLCWKAKDL